MIVAICFQSVPAICKVVDEGRSSSSLGKAPNCDSRVVGHAGSAGKLDP